MTNKSQQVATQISAELAAMALEAREAGLTALAFLLDMARMEADKSSSEREREAGF